METVSVAMSDDALYPSYAGRRAEGLRLQVASSTYEQVEHAVQCQILMFLTPLAEVTP